MSDVIRSIRLLVNLAYASCSGPDSCALLDALRLPPFLQGDREEEVFAAPAHAHFLLGIKMASPTGTRLFKQGDGTQARPCAAQPQY